MYVDFKEEATMQPGFSNGLLWMLSGVMMGLLVGLAMYYFANRGIPSVEAASASKDIQNNMSADSKGVFAKDQTVSSPFGESTETDTPDDLMVASLVDKNHKEEVKERPNFSYYAVLPDLNVPVQTIHNPPAVKSTVVDKKDASKVGATAIAGGKSDFVLQVASFQQRNQADRAKGRLKGKGLSSYVEEKKIKGKTWFRVMAGPVESKKLDNWKATVAALGHKPLVYAVK